MKAILFRLQFCILLALSSMSMAQNGGQLSPNTQDQVKAGTITYFGDPRIESLLKTKRRINKKDEGIKGFRIQLYSGDRQQANEIKGQFLNEYEEVEAYIIYEQPYFKTRVGDFRTKIEAEKFKRELNRAYAGCFILGDAITPKKPKEGQ